MKFGIDFQHLPAGSVRPIDDGEIVGITADSKTGTMILPAVGDYVHIDNSMDGGERSAFSGKVKSHLFTYIRGSDDEVYCSVNIVVADTHDDFGGLIKE